MYIYTITFKCFVLFIIKIKFNEFYILNQVKIIKHCYNTKRYYYSGSSESLHSEALWHSFFSPRQVQAKHPCQKNVSSGFPTQEMGPNGFDSSHNDTCNRVPMIIKMKMIDFITGVLVIFKVLARLMQNHQRFNRFGLNYNSDWLNF